MIGSIGSRLAFSVLFVAGLAAAPAFAAGGLSFDDSDAAAAQADDGSARWFNLEYQDQGSVPTFALLFGIPETDAVLFSTSCAPGSNDKSVKVDLMVDYGTSAVNDEVSAVIEAGSKTFSFPARVFADSDEFSGVRLRIGRKSPVWSALRGATEPKFGMEGGPGMFSASAIGAEKAMADFAAKCLGDTSASAMTTAPAAEPGEAASMPLIALPKTAADPAVDTFACEDGSVVRIGGKPTAPRAMVSLASGKALSLIPSTASFGEKYTDGSTTLRVSGATAQLTTGDGNQLCTMR